MRRRRLPLIAWRRGVAGCLRPTGLVVALVVGARLAGLTPPLPRSMASGMVWWLALTVIGVLFMRRERRTRAAGREKASAEKPGLAMRPVQPLPLPGYPMRSATRGDVLLADRPAPDGMRKLAGELRAYDEGTWRHSQRVQEYALMIGEQLRLTPLQLDRLAWAALLHDIGKLNIAQALLNRSAAPDSKQWTLLRKHPSDGGALIAPFLQWFGDWAQGVTQHHERWDGSGYPSGTAGDEIGLAARIIAVAEAYDAMLASAPYHRGLSDESARAELEQGAGTQFDPEMVSHLLNALAHGKGPKSGRKKASRRPSAGVAAGHTASSRLATLPSRMVGAGTVAGLLLVSAVGADALTASVTAKPPRPVLDEQAVASGRQTVTAHGPSIKKVRSSTLRTTSTTGATTTTTTTTSPPLAPSTTARVVTTIGRAPGTTARPTTAAPVTGPSSPVTVPTTLAPTTTAAHIANCDGGSTRILSHTQITKAAFDPLANVKPAPGRSLDRNSVVILRSYMVNSWRTTVGSNGRWWTSNYNANSRYNSGFKVEANGMISAGPRHFQYEDPEGDRFVGRVSQVGGGSCTFTVSIR